MNYNFFEILKPIKVDILFSQIKIKIGKENNCLNFHISMLENS